MSIARFLPIVTWLPRYDRAWLPLDIIAGLTVWALVVPESLAYAGIAGVPVQYGIYAVPLAVIGYLVFGSSRQLFVGPSATVASISAVAVGAVAAGGATGANVVVLSAALSLMVGAMYVIGGLMRLGFIARFFAKPVLDGFIVGLGLYIAVGQVHKLVGIPSPSGDTVQVFIRDLVALPTWEPWTAAVGVLALTAMFGMARFTPRVPGALVVVVVSIIATKVLDLAAHGVAVVGTVPTGFRFESWTTVSLDDLTGLVPGAIAIVVVGFAQSVAIAKAYAAKYGYRIDASQEMIGYGAANLGSGLLQGITVTGSLSKSGAAEEAGGKSPVLLAVVSLLVLLTILFLAGLFADLPEAVLAAVVIHAVSGMMRPTELVRLRRAHQVEFWSAAAALAGVVLIGILAGIVIGVAASFLLLIRQLDHPHVGILGHEEAGGPYRDLATHPGYAAVPGALLYRFEAPLIFANAEIFTDDLLARVAEPHDPALETVILDMETVAEVDTTGADALRVIHGTLASRGIGLRFARTTASVVALLRANGDLGELGEDHFYRSLAEAVTAHRATRA